MMGAGLHGTDLQEEPFGGILRVADDDPPKAPVTFPKTFKSWQRHDRKEANHAREQCERLAPCPGAEGRST